MNAVIVAAGLSSRLRPLTDNLPKPLLTINGDALIERSVNILVDAGIKEVTVVVGYMRDKIQQHMGDHVHYVHNPFYPVTGNLASCWFGLSALSREPLLYLHGDLVFSPVLIKRILSTKLEEEAVLLVDFDSIDEEAMKVRIEKHKFIESSKDIPLPEAAGEWTGIARFSAGAKDILCHTIDSLLAEGNFHAYDTVAFNRMSANGFDFGVIPTDGLPWYEIDTPDDLTRARRLFGEVLANGS